MEGARKCTLRGLLLLCMQAVSILQLATAGSGTDGRRYVLSADLGTESCRVGVWDKAGELISTSSCPYPTTYPQAGWAEQDPRDWETSLQTACTAALQDKNITPAEILGICVDTTACSVVALDADKRPLRKCLLWCDARSARQTEAILRLGAGDPHLQVNNAGAGPMSAEWMLPKALWVKENEPEVWAAAAHVCEKNDYVNFLLTGELVASGCNTAARWNFIGAQRPESLLQKLGMEDLLGKWPRRRVAMGELVGGLTADAAGRLHLLAGTPVFQGGPDAYVGMIGLGASEPRKMALITGSSHLHLCVSDSVHHGDGFWGSYTDAPLAGLSFAEGGQSSTGSLLQWARRLFGGASSLAELDDEAARVPIGSEGVLALETFQGSRTPITDPLYRGALVGLSLFHTRGHVWRALLESICLGTRACVEALSAAGLGADELYVGGGAVRSELFIQMHADATGLPVVIMHQENAPLLGGAVLAAAGCGLLDGEAAAGAGAGAGAGAEAGAEAAAEELGATRRELLARVRRASGAMVRVKRRILPDPAATRAYQRLFAAYAGLGPALRGTVHSLACLGAPLASSTEGSTIPAAPAAPTAPVLEARIVPSFLSADAGALAGEAALCAGLCKWIHVDACDGCSMAPGALSSLGPQAVAALRCAAPGLKIDVHLVHQNPTSLVAAFAAAGATRLTLQLEQLGSAVECAQACRAVRAAGMACGLCLAPGTAAEALLPLAHLLLGSEGSGPVVEFVDILAVPPGVGGQTPDWSVLSKVAFVRAHFSALPHVGIDGGVDEETIARAARAGANFFISGTGVFGRARRAGSRDDGAVAANVAKLRAKLDKEGM